MQRLASSLRRGIALFRERPLLANMVSYPTLYVCAEFSQQTILMRLDESRKNYDWKTMVRYAIFATTASAPFLHYWYRYLDRVIPAKGTKEAIQKSLTDQAVSSTILLAIFYTFSFWGGNSVDMRLINASPYGTLQGNSKAPWNTGQEERKA